MSTQHGEGRNGIDRNGDDQNATDEQFVTQLRQQVRRAQNARHTGFWQGLAALGAVGWMVVLPALVGAFAGRWLDSRFASGAFWTLTLLLLGVAVGCATAWRHVRKELLP
jgi:ATP synthase protein I